MLPARLRSICLAAGLIGNFVPGAFATSLVPSPADREVWVTMDAAVFVVATDILAPISGANVLPFLPRIAESRGVVVTTLPESAIDALSERIHRELRRCGGFVRHAGREEAFAALRQLELPLAPTVLPFAIDRPDVVAPLVANVSEAEILATITALSTNFPNRYRTQPSGTAAANAIKAQWEGLAAGRSDVTVELYSHPGIVVQPSVILSITGSTMPEQIVVLGAHEDSTSSGCSANPNCTAPGADDDASGVASITEALRVLFAANFHPHRTLQFMAFAGEEGGLLGSNDIAADYSAAGAQVVAMLQQDMTAYQGSPIDVTIIGDAAYTSSELNLFVGGLVDTYLPTLTRGTSNCGYGCSDHASFATHGYPSAIAFEAPYPCCANGAIHTPNDTVATFGGSAAHAAKFSRIAVAFAIEASLDAEPNIFVDDFESGDLAHWSSSVP